MYWLDASTRAAHLDPSMDVEKPRHANTQQHVGRPRIGYTKKEMASAVWSHYVPASQPVIALKSGPSPKMPKVFSTKSTTEKPPTTGGAMDSQTGTAS